MSRLLSRSHPLVGWLHLEAREYQKTFDRLLQCRDQEGDECHTGFAENFIDWVWQEQMPRLAQVPFYKRQIEEEVARKEHKVKDLQHQIKQLAGSLQEEAHCLDLERSKLVQLIDGNQKD